MRKDRTKKTKPAESHSIRGFQFPNQSLLADSNRRPAHYE